MQPLPELADLLKKLQIDGGELRRLIRTKETFYTERHIKRRSGRRPRLVYEVRDGLRRIHRVIAMMLAPDLKHMDVCVTGFREHHSIATNASPHCRRPDRAPTVATADIKSFFASISLDRVMGLFVRLGAAPNVAMTLARLTTLRDILPEGTRCSPAIANLIGEDVDRIVLRELPDGCSYTRYVDDLSFSGTSVPSAGDVEQWLAEAGFQLKAKSYKIRRHSQGPYVTGLFVGGESPRVPRRRRRMVERTLYYMGKGDTNRALLQMREGSKWRSRSYRSRLEGLEAMINGIGAVQPELAAAYMAQLARLGKNE
jgi:RNA-directed DNA polymerase